MFMVYWTELVSGSDGQIPTPYSQLFADDEMKNALGKCEELRKRKYSGESVHFIVMSSEDPNCVGKMGVDVTGPDYDWKKRRL